MQMLSAVVWTQLRNNKKSLFSSLQNPFRSQLSQREHCFSVWRATANETSESHCLPVETDCPLLPFLSSQSRLRALSSASQVALLTFSPRFEVRTCRMFPCSTVKKETASCSHWETTSARDLVFRKQQIQKWQLLFPSKPHSGPLPALGAAWAAVWEHFITQHSNGSTGPWNRGRGLELNPAHALPVGHKEISYTSLLKNS